MKTKAIHRVKVHKEKTLEILDLVGWLVILHTALHLSKLILVDKGMYSEIRLILIKTSRRLLVFRKWTTWYSLFPPHPRYKKSTGLRKTRRTRRNREEKKNRKKGKNTKYYLTSSHSDSFVEEREFSVWLVKKLG